MNKIKLICSVILAAVWGGYYLNFGIDGSLSQKTEVWGQFGDYIGGVVNPILSFVTIYLLLHSIGLQRESNETLSKEIKRQENLEQYKKFESRFFKLLERQDESFNTFKICITADDVDIEDIQFLHSGAAVSFIEDNLMILKKSGTPKYKIFKWLHSLDEDSSYFSIVRRFYLALKLIDDNTITKHERTELHETLINLTDIKIISMITLLCMHYNWYVIEYIKASNILDKEGMREYLATYKTND